MNLREAIKTYNELQDKEEIKKYSKALNIICEKMSKCKPKKEYYKSSNVKDYYIELPYMELTFNKGKAVFKKHYYNCTYKYKDEKSVGGNYCLSLCKYTRKK